MPMYAKLLIKAAVLLLVINVALIGVITHHLPWLAVAIFNLIALFVLLFQERSVFQTTASPNKRILFTSDVFWWISLGIGIIIRGLSAYWETSMPPILLWVLWWALFYLLCVAVFGLSSTTYLRDSGVRVIGIVALLIVLGVMAQRFGIISVSSLNQSYNNLIGRRQHTLQGIVVDTDVVIPPQPVRIEQVSPPVTTGNIQQPENKTGNLVKPADTKNDDDGKIFNTSVSSKEGTLTFENFLPVLFATLDIPASTNNYTFTFVDRLSTLYPSFVLARDYSMIGTNINPQSNISCQTLMVLLGLAQKRGVTYTSATVLDAFWAEAVEKGYTAYGCDDRTAIAQRSDLP